MQDRFYFGTNTKMFKTAAETVDYLRRLEELTCGIPRERAERFVIPSYTSLGPARTELDRAGSGILLGAQNMGWEERGQYTGEISPLMLREAGARIIMDDFGMGHNSMLYLQDSQFDMVKLDGSLVRGMTDNRRTGEIISTIVRLSESLGFRVVAEYVETPEQLEALGTLGCRYYQGYLFSPAVPLSELKKYIREH